MRIEPVTRFDLIRWQNIGKARVTMFDFLKKKEKAKPSTVYDERHFNDIIEILLVRSPTLRLNLYGDREFQLVNYSDVVAYVDKLPPDPKDSRVFSNKVGRIILAWNLNHLAQHTLKMIQSSLKSDDHPKDLIEFFSNIEFILERATPPLLNNFQVSFFDYIVNTLADTQDDLEHVLQWFGPQGLFLSYVNDKDKGKNLVGYVCKNKGIKVKHLKHEKLKNTYNPAYDYAIIAIQKWMKAYPDVMAKDLEEARKNIEKLTQLKNEERKK